MFAIYKKELRSYFTTPLGYVFCGVFLAISGFLLGVTTLYSGTVDVSSFYQIMIFACGILIPILTMKTFAEERRMKTEQLLMTAPVPVVKIVLAKFLSSYTLFVVSLAAGCLYLLPLSSYGTMNGARTLGCLIAMLLVGMCFVAVGIFVSSLTENTVTAAVGTIAIILVMVAASMFNNLIDFYPVRQLLSWISVYGRYTYFTYGIFDFSALVYYFSLTVVFLFLTVRVFDRRRWA